MTLLTRLPAAFFLCLLPLGAAAQSLFGADAPPPAQSRLHAGWATPDGSRIAGLRMELSPGWKTYWRSPGDSGIPPDFDWTGSENLKSVRIAWPAPVVFDTYGARTFGYADRMVLPLALTPHDPARPIALRLSLFYGVCSDICVPAREDLTLDIAPGAAEEGAYFIQEAFRALPRPAAEGGLTAASCAVEMTDPAAAEGVMTARLTFSPPLIATPIVIAEGPDGAWFGPSETRLEAGALVATAEMRLAPGQWIDKSALRFTILGRDRALFQNGCASLG